MTPTPSPFDRWLADADRICVSVCGLDLDSLGDGPSRDAFDAGTTARDYVTDRLHEAGYPGLASNAERSDRSVFIAPPGKGAAFHRGHPVTDRARIHY
jgi:hypothetical protein